MEARCPRRVGEARRDALRTHLQPPRHDSPHRRHSRRPLLRHRLRAGQLERHRRPRLPRRPAGVAATVETLGLHFYASIRRSFADETGYDDAIPEFATYTGSEGYGRDLVAFMRALPAAAPAPALSPEDRIARLERLIGGNGIDVSGRRLVGDPALAWLDAQGMSLFLGLALTQADLAALHAAVGAQSRPS